MTLDDVVVLILRYFTESGGSQDALRKSVHVRCRRKKFTFAISFPGVFLVNLFRRKFIALSIHLIDASSCRAVNVANPKQ